MTQNIWNYNRSWGVRRQLLAELVLREQPDVVCLQETRHDFRRACGHGQGEQIAADTGYSHVSAIGHVYLPFPRIDEGLTILTRDAPIRSMKRRLRLLNDDPGDRNRRVCLGARVQIDGAEFDIYNVHFSVSARARELNAREVLDFINACSKDRGVVLMGDLNAWPDAPPVRILTGLEGGFSDAWAMACPQAPGFTDPSWSPAERIDYVLVRNLAGRVTQARVEGARADDGTYASDHLAVVVDLDLSDG